MTARIAPVLALVLLAGCGAREQEIAAAPAAAPIPYGGPARYPEPGEPAANEQEFVWAYSDEGGVDVLARGLSNGEMIDVIFRCRPEQPAVQFGFFQKGPPTKTVAFSSGGETTEYFAAAAPPEYAESDAWVLSGELKPKDEAFLAFLQSGRMTRVFGEKNRVWDARKDSDREAIKRFAEACKDKI
jgi:hypothetical protein